MAASTPDQSSRSARLAGFTLGRPDALATAVAALILAAVVAFVDIGGGAAELIARKTTVVNSGPFILWNPNAGLGAPMLADSAYGALYPVNFIFYLVEGRPAFLIFAFLHLLMVFAGTHLLLRAARLSPVAAGMGATAAAIVIFMASGFMGFPLLAAAPWAPILAVALRRRLAGGDESATAAAGICFGLSLLAGGPMAGTLVAVTAILAVIAISRGGAEPAAALPDLTRPLLAALALGLAIGAGQLIPSIFSAQPDPEEYRALRSNERLARLFGLNRQKDSLPRVFGIPDVRYAASREDAFKTIAAQGFSGRDFVVVEGPQVSPPPSMGNSFWPMEIIVDDNDRVEVLVENKHPGWLVLLDGWAPGWQARVNGKPTPIYRADGFFRAVPVGTEATRVEFYYRPVEAVTGIWLSVGGAAVAGFLFFRRRPRLLWWPLWALILVFTPMVEGGTTYIPVTILRITALAMAALWALTLSGSTPVVFRTRLDLFAIGFWLLTAAATAASPYLYISLYWYLNITAFVMLFFLAAQFAATDQAAGGRLLLLAVVGGALQATWAIAEVGSTVRSSAGYFNPSYLAGCLMMVGPYLLARALYEWPSGRWRSGRWWALFALVAAGVVATESRAVVVWPAALLLAGWPGMVALLEASGRTPARARRLAAAVLATALVLSAAAVAVVPNPLRDRLIHISANDEFAFQRVQIWRVAASMVRDNPLGVGPGMFRYYASRYRFPINHVKGGRYEKVAENAHNEYLGLAAEMSPLAPLLILVPAAWLMVAAARAGARRKDPALTGAAAGMLVAALHALFDANLHDHALATLAVMMAGVAAAGVGRGDRRWRWPIELRPSGKRLLQVGLVTLFAVGVVANITLARSYRLALLASTERDAGRASARLVQATRQSLGNAQPWRQLAILFVAIYRESGNALFLDKAEQAGLTARKLNPADPEVYRLLGEVNLELYRFSKDQGTGKAAANYLAEALRRDPANIELFSHMASFREAQGDRQGEIEWWRRTIELEPYDLGARANLVRALAETGRTDAARTELATLSRLWQEVEETRRRDPSVFRRPYQLQRVALTARELAGLKEMVGGLDPGRGAR